MTIIVNSIAGSRLYGTNHANSDEDTMGIGVADKQNRLGLNYKDQDGADDHVVYELTKWTRLAVNGNPTILQMLWVNDIHALFRYPGWGSWQNQLREAVLSQRCIPAFLGYMEGQRRKVLSNRGQRPDLINLHGFDTKFAAHMIRLGLQGIEVSTMGHMTLPCAEAPLLKDVLAGKYSQTECLDMAAGLENTLKTTLSILPEQTDPATIDRLLVDIYEEVWES